MAIPATIESIDSVDEKYRPLYIEQDGRFILDVDHESIKSHPATGPLVRGKEMVADERNAARNELAEAKRKIAELEASLKQPGKKEAGDDSADLQMQLLKQQLEAAEARSEEFRIKSEKEAQARLQSDASAKIDNLLRQAGITEPTFVELANVGIMQNVSFPDGQAIIQTPDGGAYKLDEYVKKWVAERGSAMITKPSGGGAAGSSPIGASVTKEAFAAMGDTERVALLQSDPDTFNRLSSG